MSYRVDNIPFAIKPLFYLYAYFLAALGYLMIGFLRLTCHIEFVGNEHSIDSKNGIYAIWHENLFPYFMVYLKYNEPYAWINHPLWYMKPVHIILHWMGLKKLFLGSSGHGGKDALEQIINEINCGYNTMVACDGPAGPYKVLKKGVLEMSRQTGVPVIPISFELSNYFILPGWDKKILPLPFTTVKVTYQESIVVTDNNYEEAKRKISQLMG